MRQDLRASGNLNRLTNFMGKLGFVISFRPFQVQNDVNRVSTVMMLMDPFDAPAVTRSP